MDHSPTTPPVADSPSLRSSPLFWCAICASTAVSLSRIFAWPLVSLLTVFLEPILEIALALVLLVVTLIALVQAIRNRATRNPRRWIPFGICLLSVVIVVFVPFTAIYLKADFYLFRSRRTEVARQLLAGKTGSLINSGGRGDFITLSTKDHLLSDDGEVVVDHRNGKAFVLFFTFRGILDRFSGFVYSPTDDPPARDQFLGDGIEIERLAPHWYWYAS